MTTRILALLAAFMLFPFSARAEVRVTFVNPQNYSDFSSEPARQRDEMLSELRQTLIEAGARYLPPGQTLSIDVFDVQRAGLFRDSTPSHVAILTPNTPPHFEIAFSLRQNGKLLLQAREAVTDVDYFIDPSSHLSSDRLVYEKQVLRDWMRKRFADKIPPGQ